MEHLTKKRLWLVGSAAVIIVAALLALAMSRNSALLQARFEFYAIDGDGTTRMAVLSLTNETRYAFQMPLCVERPPVSEGVFTARYAYMDQVKGAWTNWNESPVSPGGYSALALAPHSQVLVAVPLSAAVSARRAGVQCIREPSSETIVDRSTAFVMRLLPARFRRAALYQAWCPTELSWEEAGLTFVPEGEEPSQKAQPSGPANESQPIRSATNSTSSAAGSRR